MSLVANAFHLMIMAQPLVRSTIRHEYERSFRLDANVYHESPSHPIPGLYTQR